MSIPSAPNDLVRVDEPQGADDFAAVLSQVAAARQPVIVRRSGHDLVALVPLEHLEFISEGLALQEVEKRASRLDWNRVPPDFQPPKSWFDDEDDNPFEPE
jgi:PHD/YefM family antitoxin component YafN of YafNO toxin-antitoxin module